MKNLALILFIVLFIRHIEAVLPPLYQTSKEIIMIMSDEQLGKKLQSGEVIEKIEKNDLGYEITTNKNQLQVNVVYEPLQQPGPAHYNLLFNHPTPLTTLPERTE